MSQVEKMGPRALITGLHGWLGCQSSLLDNYEGLNCYMQLSVEAGDFNPWLRTQKCSWHVGLKPSDEKCPNICVSLSSTLTKRTGKEQQQSSFLS